MGTSNQHLKLIVYSSLMAALTAVGAYIVIPVGPVPIALQSLFVMLAGLLLGARWGSICIGVYLLAGLIGLPVFASGTAGIGKFLGPTGGYLVGFVFAAFLIGYITEKGKQKIISDVAAMICGIAVIYIFGVLWLKFASGLSLSKTLVLGVLPFLPGDFVKIVIAIPVIKVLRPMMAISFESSNSIKSTHG
jgi:biotin transport system substrate-specific component